MMVIHDPHWTLLWKVCRQPTCPMEGSVSSISSTYAAEASLAISGVVGAWKRIAPYAVDPSKPLSKSDTPGSPDVVILFFERQIRNTNVIVKGKWVSTGGQAK